MTREERVRAILDGWVRGEFERRVFYRHYWDKKTIAEIAEEMDRSDTCVQDALRRARIDLAGRL